jgi:hypothetical protein
MLYEGIRGHGENWFEQAILAHLERLRRRIEKDFPDARGFLRPGFDRIDLND